MKIRMFVLKGCLQPYSIFSHMLALKKFSLSVLVNSSLDAAHDCDEVTCTKIKSAMFPVENTHSHTCKNQILIHKFSVAFEVHCPLVCNAFEDVVTYYQVVQCLHRAHRWYVNRWSSTWDWNIQNTQGTPRGSICLYRWDWRQRACWYFCWRPLFRNHGSGLSDAPRLKFLKNNT